MHGAECIALLMTQNVSSFVSSVFGVRRVTLEHMQSGLGKVLINAQVSPQQTKR